MAEKFLPGHALLVDHTLNYFMEENNDDYMTVMRMMTA